MESNIYLFVLIPMGIPAMGKDFFSRLLLKITEKYGFFYESICNDEIIKERMSKIKNVSEIDEKYKESSLLARSDFYSKIKETFEKVIKLKKEHNIIFIDKIHPPDNIAKLFFFLRHDCPSESVNMKLICVIPEIFQGLQTTTKNKTENYPFSISFLFTCLYRAQIAMNSKSLKDVSINKKLRVVLLFFQLYRDFSFSKENLKNILKFHYIMKLPFVYEDENSVELIPKDLKDFYLNKICGNFKILKDDNNKNVNDFINEFISKNLKFYDLDEELFESKFEISLYNMIKMFNKNHQILKNMEGYSFEKENELLERINHLKISEKK